MLLMNHDLNTLFIKNANGGYIALMATIIISVILLVMAAQEASSGWYARYNILGTEAKEQSSALAEGCADQALAMLITDPDYRGNAPITTAGGTCHVFDVTLNTPLVGFVTIATQAEVRDAYTNLQLTTDMGDIHIGDLALDRGIIRVKTYVRSGSATAEQWTIHVTATAPDPSFFPGSESIAYVTVDPGGYDVYESGSPPGYTALRSSGCTGSIAGGDTKDCIITLDGPPTSPLSCADTVMMLDRTESMMTHEPGALAKEKDAARSLIDAYASVSPSPTIGVGVFGDGSDNEGSAPAQIVGLLTNTDYASLKSAVNSWLAIGEGFTNLGDAINKADTELNSVRHDPTKPKVLILVSDGVPNRPANESTGEASALAAADAAKLGDTDIYTVHFGDANGRPFLASLASGANTYDPLNPTGVSSSGYVSPSEQVADAGGDDNGFEINPTGAFADDASFARNIDGKDDRHLFYGYDFSAISSEDTINGIEVKLNWWLESVAGSNSMDVELSWDGGTTWTSKKPATDESISHTNTSTLGAPDDTWGHAWTADDLTSANFRVRVTANSQSSIRDFSLDWVPVQVTYNDGDKHFFVAPTAADMPGIFNLIGRHVCPAILGPASPIPPLPAPPPPDLDINPGAWQEIPTFTS